MDALTTLRQELLKEQIAMKNCQHECGVLKGYKKTDFQEHVRKARELITSINILEDLYGKKRSVIWPDCTLQEA